MRDQEIGNPNYCIDTYLWVDILKIFKMDIPAKVMRVINYALWDCIAALNILLNIQSEGNSNLAVFVNPICLLEHPLPFHSKIVTGDKTKYFFVLLDFGNSVSFLLKIILFDLIFFYQKLFSLISAQVNLWIFTNCMLQLFNFV